MKTIKFLRSKILGMLLLMVPMLPIPAVLLAQTPTPAPPDSSLIPWIGIWKVLDDPAAAVTNQPQVKSVLEIRPTASGKGLDISRKAGEKSVQEVVIPDGMQRSLDSKNCIGSQTYNWEPQAGLLLGSSEIKCTDAAAYTISNLKMIVSGDRMVDILAIKSSGQTRLAVRHFSFESPLPSVEEALPVQALAMRTAISAPWDLERVVHLSKSIDTALLEAALLEKNTQLNLNTKSLKQLNSAKVPKSIIDLLVALAVPEKFNIQKNGKIAVASYAPSPSKEFTYPTSQYPYSSFSYYDPYGRLIYPGYYPWDYYWSYNSPFWWGYPIYINPGSTGNNSGSGGGGGGGGTPAHPSPYSGGRLSSESGYVQITPRDTGHRAVPRDGYIPSGGSNTYVGSSSAISSSSSGSSSSYSTSSGGSSSYSGGGSSASSSGGGSSAPSASPSGYSSGGSSSGHAVPRN